MKSKDINKLKIGETYYIPNGTWAYRKVTLVEILDSKGALVSDKKNKKFRVSIGCKKHQIKPLADLKQDKESDNK